MASTIRKAGPWNPWGFEANEQPPGVNTKPPAVTMRIEGTIETGGVNAEALRILDTEALYIEPREVKITMTGNSSDALTANLRSRLCTLVDAYLQAKHDENQIIVELGLIGSCKTIVPEYHQADYSEDNRTRLGMAEHASTMLYADILKFGRALQDIGLTRAELLDVFEGVLDTSQVPYYPEEVPF